MEKMHIEKNRRIKAIYVSRSPSSSSKMEGLIKMNENESNINTNINNKKNNDYNNNKSINNDKNLQTLRNIKKNISNLVDQVNYNKYH
jgi:hypothetical protein